MSSSTGFNSPLDTTGIVGTDDLFSALIALIPDPDAAHGTGAVQGAPAQFLEEMSPAAAAELRLTLFSARTYCNNATIPGA